MTFSTTTVATMNNQPVKAKRRALAALKEHGRLVQDRHWGNAWRAPGQLPLVCGTGTINRLVEDGLVETRWGTTHREAVLTDEGKR